MEQFPCEILLFHPSEGQSLAVWIGLISESVNPAVFKWIDHNDVTFTYWNPNHPVQPTQAPSCVFYSGEVRFGVCVSVCVVCYTSLCFQPSCAGMCDIRLVSTTQSMCGFFFLTRVHLQTHGWQVGNCTHELPFMCQRKGEVNESAQSGCPAVSFSCII